MEPRRLTASACRLLFRWRKELCKHSEASIAPFVPVAIGSSVPMQEAAEASVTTTAVRRPRSQGIIEIYLGRGQRVPVDGDVNGDALRRVFGAPMISVPTGARVCSRPATRICADAFRRWHFRCRSCCARTRPAVICLPWSAQQSCENDLARWSGGVPVYKEARERRVHLAIRCQ